MKIFKMKAAVLVLLMVLGLMSFNAVKSLQGTWVYDGGIYNGNKEAAPTEYKLQRKYSQGAFEAFLIEKGSKPQKYQAGKYTLSADSCMETETFSAQPSKLTHVKIHYAYRIKGNILILSGRLPNGTVVEERWKKVN